MDGSMVLEKKIGMFRGLEHCGWLKVALTAGSISILEVTG